MSSGIADGVTDLFKPQFTTYDSSPKLPTPESIQRLENTHGHLETENGTTRYYLAAVRLGVMSDPLHEPPVFPAAKLVYVSQSGYAISDTIRAEVTDDGTLDPVVDVKPSIITTESEGRLLSHEELHFYAGVLEDAHKVAVEEVA